MFTGIIKAIGRIVGLQPSDTLLRYSVEFPQEFLENLELGASVSVEGICQTVVEIEGNCVWFDAIAETTQRTTLSSLSVGSLVNLERAAKVGDEIGGHLLSGHVYGMASILGIKDNIYTLECPTEWMRYLFPKGFIAIDGISLTLVDTDKMRGRFTVHLIPETLKRTTLGKKKQGGKVNLEIDSLTQMTVDTLLSRFLSMPI